MTYKILSEELVAILVDVVKNDIYGSVEIFFEKGKITQVTQRIIKKVGRHEDNHRNNYNDNKKQSMADPYNID